MSFWDVEPEDWIRRFFSGSRGMPRQFDEMRREMERMFEEQFKDIQTIAPKELVREYETPQGGKVREIGPIVYGYSAIIGPDGKPKVREFGNIKPSAGFFGGGMSKPEISGELEPMIDVNTTDKEVKVVAEIPGINKQNIKVNAYDSSVEITATGDTKRKYHRIVDLPSEADIETAKSTYNNGILEITFNKKKQTKPKGKEIKVE
jgi:HSP20 family protein